MPRKCEWIHRLAGIQAQLKTLPPGAPLDRSAIELLFQVRPRQATRILHRLGAGSAGGALVIACGDLRARLDQLNGQAAVDFELKRRRGLCEQLLQARREFAARSILIPPRKAAAGPPEIDSLPPEIRLEPGQLTVHFSSPVELLQNLLYLAQAVSSDWPAFEARLSRTLSAGQMHST